MATCSIRGFCTPPLSQPDFVHKTALYTAPSFLTEPLSSTPDICSIASLCATADILCERCTKVEGCSTQSRDRVITRICCSCRHLAPDASVPSTLASLGLLELYPYVAARVLELQCLREQLGQQTSSSSSSSSSTFNAGQIHSQASISSQCSGSSSSQSSSPAKGTVGSEPASPSKKPAVHLGWSHLYYTALANQVVMMCGQLHEDAGNTRQHRYAAHQMALLYQCLNQVSPSETKPLKALIEEHFDEVKQFADGKSAMLPPEYCDWLQDMTWTCREEMASCPAYLRRRLQPVAAVVPPPAEQQQGQR